MQQVRYELLRQQITNFVDHTDSREELYYSKEVFAHDFQIRELDQGMGISSIIALILTIVLIVVGTYIFYLSVITPSFKKVKEIIYGS